MLLDNLPVLYADLGVITRADGSALFCQGHTSVMGSVYGPGEVKHSLEIPDKSYVEVNIRIKWGHQHSLEDKSIESSLKNTLEASLLRTFYPRTCISITLQEMEDRGAEYSAFINAATLALLDSGTDLRYLLAGVTVALNSSGKFVPDPDLRLILQSSVVLNFVIESKNRGIVSTNFYKGKCDGSTFDKAVEVAIEASKNIFTFYKETIAKKFSKEL